MKKLFTFFAILALTLSPVFVAQSSAATQENVTLEFPTGILNSESYYMNSFSVRSENDDYEICLFFNHQLGSGNFSSYLSTDISDSYIQPKGGAKKEISSATATVTYYGAALRALMVEANLQMMDGSAYNVAICTNEEENYATFEEDVYNKSPIEASWKYNMDLKLANNPYNVLNGFDASAAYMFRQQDHLLKWYTSLQGSQRYENFHVQLQFFIDENKSGIIPSGVYPINSTGNPGSVCIGALPGGDYPYLTYEGNSYNSGCGSFFHYEIECDTISDPNYSDYYYLHRFDYVLRAGYVEVYNNNETYIIHVHAYADAYHTTGKGVVDFYINGASESKDPAEFIPADWDDVVYADSGNEGGEGDEGDEGEGGPDVTTNIRQGISANTTTILYPLEAQQGLDGITYQPVDVGAGIAWADKNLGASTPQARGRWFYWGGTTDGKGGYMGYFYDTYTKNTPADYVLKSNEDAATVLMGSNWRMATYSEWNDLIANADISDLGTFTNRADNSQSIYLPATGYRNQGSILDASGRYYWTSMLCGPATNYNQKYAGVAWTAYSPGGNAYEVDYMWVFNDACVRAVYVPDFTVYTLTINVGSLQYVFKCQAGQKVTLNPVSVEGGAFEGWYYADGTTQVSNDPLVNGNTFTVSGNATYTAKFSGGDVPPVIDPVAPVSKDIYQNVSANTTTIVYPLEAQQGLDGNTYQPVDLGYGIAWADRNVGAYSPEDVGDYFRWGDPVAQISFYDDINTQGMNSGYILSPSMDMATVNMGACWRTPTDDDLYDLKTQTDIQNNEMFVNFSDASQYIILPAGGYKGAQGPYDEDYQYYWSSVYFKYGQKNLAYVLMRDGYNSYSVGLTDNFNQNPLEIYYGMPVRAVYEPQFTVYTLTINVGSYQYVYKCQAGQQVTITANANANYMFDSWSDNGSTDATRTFTMTSNVTASASFKKAASQTTITFNANKGNGGQTGSVTATKGQAMPAISAVPTRAGYTFLGYFDGLVGGTKYYNADKSSARSWDKDDTNATLYAQWSVCQYTIIFQNEDGTQLQSSEFSYGAMPVYSGEIPAKAPTHDYTYEHNGWTPTVAVVTGPQTYTATFAAIEIPKYKVTIHGTYDGMISISDGVNTYTTENLDPDDGEAEYSFLPGTELTLSLIPSSQDNTWGWWTDEDYLIVNSEQQRVVTLSSNLDLYAIFGLETLSLNGQNGAAAYNDYSYYMVHNLVYERKFNVKDWQAMWLPFDIDVAYQGLQGTIYTLSKSELTEASSGVIDVSLSFHKNENGMIQAGDLCLVYFKQEVSDFMFKDIMFAETIAPHNTSVGTGTSKVHFIGKTTYGKIGGEGSEALQKSYRYLKGNTLYYPKLDNGVTMQAFNCYFQIDDYNYWYGGGASTAPRLHIFVDGEEITEAETDDTMETKKYIDANGNLIIERGGIRFDAQGKKLD